MDLLQTAWAWFIDLLSSTIKFIDPAINWLNDNRYVAAIALLVGFFAALKTFLPSNSPPKENKKNSSHSSTAEDIAKAAITSYEQGKQSAASELQQDLAQRDQQIAALTKAVEALQTERSEAETETEQTTIDTALAHLKDGNTSEAEAIFEEILETETKRGHEANKQAASAARHIGALAFLHDTEKALNAYKRAVKLDPDNAEGWNELGHLQDRIGQLDQAIKSYETVLRVGNSTANQFIVATALGNLGVIYEKRGNLEKAEDAQLKSLKIEEQLGNKQGIANSYNNLGIIYETRGDLKKAEETQLKALKIYEQLDNIEGIANSYNNLGSIYTTLEDLEKAEGAQLKALKLNEQLGNKQGIANSYGNLGNIYQARDDLNKAEGALLIALKIFEQLGEKKGMAASLTSLGIIYETRKDLNKAKDVQLKSLKINNQLSNKYGMASNLANLGHLLKFKGNMDEACTHWQKALELFAEVGAKPEIELVSSWLKDANCPDIKTSASD